MEFLSGGHFLTGSHYKLRPNTEGLLSTEEVVKEYLRFSVRTGNAWENSKYCVLHTLRNEQETGRGKAVREAKSLRDMCLHFGTVHVFRQKFTLEDAIEFHAFAPLEALASVCVTSGIPLGSQLLLPVGTVNSVQTLKVLTTS
jgi:hypothetical protein